MSEPRFLSPKTQVRYPMATGYRPARTAPCSAKVTIWNCSEGTSVQVEAAKEKRLIANMIRTWP